MEPISLALGLVGEAVFGAAVGIVGQETFFRLKHRLSSRWLRNCDVARALNEAYIAALSVLERDFDKRGPDPETRRAGRDAFERLRRRAPEWFPADGATCALSEAQAAGMLGDRRIAGQLTERIVEAAAPPPAVADLLRSSFADSFVFAFREVGVKSNEKVRTAITQEMLQAIRESGEVANEKLDAIRTGLQDLPALLSRHESILRFQERFAESLAGAATKIEQIADGQQELKVMLRMALDGAGPPRAYAVVSDREGRRLARHPITGTLVTIGRDEGNTLQLPHAAV